MNMITQYIGVTFASVGLAFYLSWKLTLVILAGLPIAIILLPVFSARVQPNLQQQAAKLSEATKHASNAFSAIETVKFYNGEGLELWKYSSVIQEAGRFFSGQSKWNALQAGILRFITLSMFVQGFWFGISLLDKSEITVAQIVTAFWAAVSAVQAIMQTMPHLIVLEKGRTAGQKLRTVMSHTTTSLRKLQSRALEIPDTCVVDIAFNKVCPILTSINSV
jgi:ATP-binding cassette subfamily B (MDR/TAP) protein 1